MRAQVGRRTASALLTQMKSSSRAPISVVLPSTNLQYLQQVCHSSTTVPMSVIHQSRSLTTNRLLSRHDGHALERPQPSSWNHLQRQRRQVRGLAISRKKRKTRQENNNTGNLPLMNEDLVKKLMAQKALGSSPDHVTLRLVVEEGGGTPVRSEETSLRKAIQTSLDLGLDLVEIDLDQSIPVVRAVQYEAKVYNQTKKSKTKSKDPFATVKEFRFRAKTADHDFQRKVGGVMAALEKGHKCKVSATCPSRVVASTIPEGAGQVMHRILEAVEEVGNAPNPPEVNKEKTHASVMLLPRKKK